MAEVDYDALLNTATEIGYLLLENGAEIYRVEESMRRIFDAYGVVEREVFAIPSCIIVTVCTEEGHSLTKIRRIYARGTNLTKVNRFNDLCRRICRTTPALSAVEAEIERINTTSSYRLIWQVLAWSLVAAAFTLFWGGGLADAACAVVCGAAMKLVCRFMEKFDANAFFMNIIGSCVAAAVACCAVYWNLAAGLDKIIIGTLMNLVPGIAITNVMRDIIGGDLIAGLTKLTESLLIATAIALGAGIALSVARMLGAL